jgi:hypothetical protein
VCNKKKDLRELYFLREVGKGADREEAYGEAL